GDARGEPVIIAKADLGGSDRIVLVDDWSRAERQKLGEGGPRVQVPAALLGILGGQEDLGDGDAVARERLLIGMGELDLAGRDGRLFFLEPQPLSGEAEMPAADRDRPG